MTNLIFHVHFNKTRNSSHYIIHSENPTIYQTRTIYGKKKPTKLEGKMVYYELHSYSAIHADKAKKNHNIIKFSIFL